MEKEKPKKVVIKFHEDGRVEILSKDPGVALVILTPDDAEIEYSEDGKQIFTKKGLVDQEDAG